MILTVNIGNSVITLGGFEGDELSFVARLSSHERCTEDEYAARIMNTLTLHGISLREIKGAVMSSVVPPLNPTVRKAIGLVCGRDPLTVGPGVKTGIGIRCDLPSSVGADIICACVAVGALYGAPAVIVDMDTVTKISVIDGSGAFIGASILPGVQMGLEALSDRTAQLPGIELTAPDRIIAKNTADCMRSGVIYGNAAMIDGLTERICRELGGDIPVYVTGDQSSTILPFCQRKMVQRDHLVLHGLYAIYKRNS